jgi:hypothetical protein
MSPERVNRFADTTEDHQWIHVEAIGSSVQLTSIQEFELDGQEKPVCVAEALLRFIGGKGDADNTPTPDGR